MDIQETNRRVIDQFRSGGPIEGMQRDRLVLLTTTGRRSGEPRTTPMMFHRDGERVLVIASNIGARSIDDITVCTATTTDSTTAINSPISRGRLMRSAPGDRTTTTSAACHRRPDQQKSNPLRCRHAEVPT